MVCKMLTYHGSSSSSVADDDHVVWSLLLYVVNACLQINDNEGNVIKILDFKYSIWFLTCFFFFFTYGDYF